MLKQQQLWPDDTQGKIFESPEDFDSENARAAKAKGLFKEIKPLKGTLDEDMVTELAQKHGVTSTLLKQLFVYGYRIYQAEDSLDLDGVTLDNSEASDFWDCLN